MIVPTLLFFLGLEFAQPDLVLGMLVMGCAELLGFVCVEILLERIDHA